MEVLERYFAAMVSHDWVALSECLAEDVRRTGPYLDVVEGRDAYVAFLAEVVPSLPNYELEVVSTDEIVGGGAVVRLSETLDVDGQRTKFPEALLFEFDSAGLIARVDIYIKHGRSSNRRTRAEPKRSVER